MFFFSFFSALSLPDALSPVSSRLPYAVCLGDILLLLDDLDYGNCSLAVVSIRTKATKRLAEALVWGRARAYAWHGSGARERQEEYDPRNDTCVVIN